MKASTRIKVRGSQQTHTNGREDTNNSLHTKKEIKMPINNPNNAEPCQ